MGRARPGTDAPTSVTSHLPGRRCRRRRTAAQCPGGTTPAAAGSPRSGGVSAARVPISLRGRPPPNAGQSAYAEMIDILLGTGYRIATTPLPTPATVIGSYYAERRCRRGSWFRAPRRRKALRPLRRVCQALPTVRHSPRATIAVMRSTASPDDDLRRQLNAVALTESGPIVEGVPIRWTDDPTWRCAGLHVSKRSIEGRRGRTCVFRYCGLPVRPTFPEDRSGYLDEPHSDRLPVDPGLFARGISDPGTPVPADGSATKNPQPRTRPPQRPVFGLYPRGD